MLSQIRHVIIMSNVLQHEPNRCFKLYTSSIFYPWFNYLKMCEFTQPRGLTKLVSLLKCKFIEDTPIIGDVVIIQQERLLFLLESPPISIC
jgi:hypothetical protein